MSSLYLQFILTFKSSGAAPLCMVMLHIFTYKCAVVVVCSSVILELFEVGLC